jgi:MFS transporter, putative metabolite:H+ symporter
MIPTFSEPRRMLIHRFDSLPLKALHVALACGCAVGLGIDLLEISVSNALSAVFSSPPYALSPDHLAWLLASAYIGAIAGAPLAGWFADRKGLQPALLIVFLWLGVTSVLAAARSNILWFTSFRFLSGVSLGACPPLIIAYLTSVAPPRYRGLMILWVCGLAYLVPPFGVFLIRWLTPLQPYGIEGWRWPFLLAGVASLMVGLIFLRLPESPRWLTQMGRDRLAARVCDRFERSPTLSLLDRWLETRSPAQSDRLRTAGTLASVSRAGFRYVIPFVVALYFLHPWMTSTFQLLTGPMLLERGYDLRDVLLYVALSTFGPAIGTFLAAFLVDGTSRRVSLLLTAALMASALIAFFVLDGRVMLAGAVITFAVGVAVYTPIMTMHGSELIPTAIRGSATGFAWAANRLSAALVPIAMIPLVGAYGSVMVAWVVACALLLSIILAASGPRGAAGAAVE